MSNKRSGNQAGLLIIFLIAFSSFTGSLLFLRMGYSAGALGFSGTAGVIIAAFLIITPAIFALLEYSSGDHSSGNIYPALNRHFGLNWGALAGTLIYLSLTINIAFNILTFTEVFSTLFTKVNFLTEDMFRTIISSVSLLLLSYLIIKNRVSEFKPVVLFLIAALIILSIAFFLAGQRGQSEFSSLWFSFQKENIRFSFFNVFSILFPAFSGILAGVFYAGATSFMKQKPEKGILLAIVVCFFVYLLVAYKLTISATPSELTGDQFIMNKIALSGHFIIAPGLAAASIFGAVISFMVAPDILSHLAADGSLPVSRINAYITGRKNGSRFSHPASLITTFIAFIFVITGALEVTAKILSMIFVVCFGLINLLSFPGSFNSDPLYRPRFRTKWYISLTGFLVSVWFIFRMDPYAGSIALLALLFYFLLIRNQHPERKGTEPFIGNMIYSLHRYIMRYLRKDGISGSKLSVLCISDKPSVEEKLMKMLGWIAAKGYGTYLHLVEGNFRDIPHEDKKDIRDRISEAQAGREMLYSSIIISPSFAAALEQSIQMPGISGEMNNSFLFDLDRNNTRQADLIARHCSLLKKAGMNILVFVSGQNREPANRDIDLWISRDYPGNFRLMAGIAFSIHDQTYWRKGKVTIREIISGENKQVRSDTLDEIISSSYLPITADSVDVIETSNIAGARDIINSYSQHAGLTIIGFDYDDLRSDKSLFSGYNELDDMLFVNASQQ